MVKGALDGSFKFKEMSGVLEQDGDIEAATGEETLVSENGTTQLAMFIIIIIYSIMQ